ncbi:MAG TPA: DcaP family trimeric outer membrane transporter [Sedimentisphaerales bacterium]|nr:DcaP family trimeric outer membrane transporter [Sedimentisphaerales bacterium]
MRQVGILVFAAMLTAAGVCRADTSSDLARENEELRKRVERLERELEELKKIVMQQVKGSDVRPEGGAVVKAEAKAGEAPKLSESDLEKIATMVQKDTEKKKPVWSDLDIQLYGYIKLDAAYDTSRTDTGNFARWVESESTNKNDDQFNMTANQTRFGVKVKGPADGEIETSGRAEIDFYEGGAENKPRIMMRHAYMNILWPQERFSILAGQTSDVISPLYPDTLNYTVGWWVGNIGYRRPQIRLTRSLGLSKDVDLKLEGALARTVGISNDFTPDSGEDAGFPGVQARASLTLPLFGYKPATVGFSGHWAKEELDTTSSGDSKHFDSWSLNLDLTQPVNEWLAIKGELFTGENLSAYLGGIGQGINTTTSKEIGSRGGWVAASLGPWDKWNFNIGASIDDVDDDDLAGSTAADRREYNRAIFGNVIYSLNKSTQIGFELSQWHTEYEGKDDGDSIRAQTSFIYKF